MDPCKLKNLLIQRLFPEDIEEINRKMLNETKTAEIPYAKVACTNDCVRADHEDLQWGLPEEAKTAPPQVRGEIKEYTIESVLELLTELTGRHFLWDANEDRFQCFDTLEDAAVVAYYEQEYTFCTECVQQQVNKMKKEIPTG